MHTVAARNSIVVDTSVFLLFVVGRTDRTLITQFKRTSTFCEKDYDTLLEVISVCDRLVVTPNILTEVSNFLGHLADPKRHMAFSILSALLESLVEVYIPSASLADLDELPAMGITDMGIIECASRGIVTLTDDFRLWGKLIAAGREAINFNHLRTI